MTFRVGLDFRENEWEVLLQVSSTYTTCMHHMTDHVTTDHMECHVTNPMHRKQLSELLLIEKRMFQELLAGGQPPYSGHYNRGREGEREGGRERGRERGKVIWLISYAK